MAGRAAAKPILVSPHKTSYIQAMFLQTAFSFSGVIQRLAGRFSGLRLRAACGFQAFLASSPYTASASSYYFTSIAPPPWRFAFSQCWPVVKLGFPILAPGSNTAVKPTRLRRSAYFGYKGFPTFASNTSPWVYRVAIDPGIVFVDSRSVPSLVRAARRCFVANGADGVTTNGH